MYKIGSEDIVLYSLVIWFFFWLYNHSYILEKFRDCINSKLPFLIKYGIGCSFCFTFWVTLFLFIMTGLPLIFLFVAPVINLFIELIYQKLSK